MGKKQKKWAGIAVGLNLVTCQFLLLITGLFPPPKLVKENILPSTRNQFEGKTLN
jgi:hypothetical protein